MKNIFRLIPAKVDDFVDVRFVDELRKTGSLIYSTTGSGQGEPSIPSFAGAPRPTWTRSSRPDNKELPTAVPRAVDLHPIFPVVSLKGKTLKIASQRSIFKVVRRQSWVTSRI